MLGPPSPGGASLVELAPSSPGGISLVAGGLFVVGLLGVGFSVVG